MVRAQLERVLFLGGAAVDRDGLETHRPGELHPEVAEPADAEDRDSVAGQGLGVPQRVIGRNTRAAHRRGFGVGELRGYPGQRGRRDRHRFRVAAGVVPARDLSVHTVNELAFAALSAVVAVTTEPTDGNAITDRESFDAGADFGDRAGDFVTQGQRPRQPGKSPATKWASVPQMPQALTLIRASPRLRWLSLDIGELQRCARGLYVNCLM